MCVAIYCNLSHSKYFSHTQQTSHLKPNLATLGVHQNASDILIIELSSGVRLVRTLKKQVLIDDMNNIRARLHETRSELGLRLHFHFKIKFHFGMR